MTNDWELLGIEITEDTFTIKKAFAEKSKLVHPEDDPEGFIRLQQAYKNCIKSAEFQKKKEKNDKNEEKTEQEEKENKVVTFSFSNLSLPTETPHAKVPNSALEYEEQPENAHIEENSPVNLEYGDSIVEINFENLEEKFSEISIKEKKSVKKIRESIRSLLNSATCNDLQAWDSFFTSPLFLDNQNNELVILELCAVINANRDIFTFTTWKKFFLPFFSDLKNDWFNTYVETKIDNVINGPVEVLNEDFTNIKKKESVKASRKVSTDTENEENKETNETKQASETKQTRETKQTKVVKSVPPRQTKNREKTKVNFFPIFACFMVILVIYSIIGQKKAQEQNEAHQKVQSAINNYSEKNQKTMYEVLPLTDDDWQLMEQEERQRITIRTAIKSGLSFSDIEDAANLLLLSEEEYNNIFATYASAPEDDDALKSSLRNYGPHEQEVISQKIKPVVMKNLSSKSFTNTGFFCLSSLNGAFSPAFVFWGEESQETLKNEIDATTHFYFEITPLKKRSLETITISKSDAKKMITDGVN